VNSVFSDEYLTNEPFCVLFLKVQERWDLKKRVEVVVFDLEKGRKVKFSFDRRKYFLIKSLFFLLIFLSVSAVVFGISLYRYYSVNESLSRKNAELKLIISRLQKHTEVMKGEMITLRNFAERVKKLVHWNVVSGDTVARGDGAQEDNLNVESRVVSEIDDSLSDPRLYYDEIKKDLESVIDAFHDRLSYLTSVPSIWPVKGWITSGFGYRISPFTHTLQFHEGVDIANAPGTPVKAPAEGYVLYAGWARGYGNVIILGHGYGISTVFGHLEKILVKQGDHVNRGDVIGLLGSTGRSTGPHLHYEVRVNGVPVNPLNFLIEEK